MATSGVVLVILGLLSMWPWAAAGAVTVYPPYVPELAAVAIELEVDGRVVGKLAGRVTEEREPTLALRLSTGLHRYAVRGTLELADGTRRAVRGEGLIASEGLLRDRLASAKRDPLAIVEAQLAEMRRLAPGATGLPRLERDPAPPPNAFGDAETRLGVRLPSTYRRLLELYGPFVLFAPGDEGEEPKAALYPPPRLLAVPAWRELVRRAPLEAGDTPRARTQVAKLAHDVVIGHSFDTVWTLRAGSHPLCADGFPSLSGEYLYENDPAEDIWVENTDAYAAYFGDVEPRCGDRTELVRENLDAALASGFEHSLAEPQDAAVRLRPDDDRSTATTLVLTLGEALRR